jgi:hypothetical protein
MTSCSKTPKDYVRGISLLHDAKKTQEDTAFSAQQRQEYGLDGLLPEFRRI